MNRRLLLVAFICLLFIKVKGDIIIINGETFRIDSESPLLRYPLFSDLKSKLTNYSAHTTENSCIYSNAEWTIINNQLYLTNLFSCDIGKPTTQADLRTIFSNDPKIIVENGKIKAAWFTGDIWMPIGEQIGHYDIMIGFYKTEKSAKFSKGGLIAIKDFNYSTPTGLNYDGGDGALTKFISETINWIKIPDLKNQIKRVIVEFETGENNKPNVKLLRSVNEQILDEEAIRVISMVPWKSYYKHGKLFKQRWTIPIVFSEELRQKYSK